MNAWLKANSALSSEQLVQLLCNGLQAVRRRCLETLSGVTVTAVIERTLHECKEKFPELSFVISDSNGLDFQQLAKPYQTQPADKLLTALTELLLELLDVFGKITADILTKYLHQELLAVTIESIAVVAGASEMPESRSLIHAKKNREQK